MGPKLMRTLCLGGVHPSKTQTIAQNFNVLQVDKKRYNNKSDSNINNIADRTARKHVEGKPVQTSKQSGTIRQ